MEGIYNITIGKTPLPFVWFRVAKTGTRTVLKVLRESDIEFDLEQGFRIPMTSCQFDEHFKFTFVRNPYDRLISGWTDKVVNGGRGGGVMKLKFLDRLKNFEYFVDWLIDQDPEKINIHYRPQTLLVPEQADFIGKTENIEHDLRHILSAIGIEAMRQIPRENASGAKLTLLTEINDRTLKNIQELYFADFQRFGYAL